MRNLFILFSLSLAFLVTGCQAQVRNARTEEGLRDAAWKLQRIMHDEAIFVPAYSVNFVRMGSWRWLRWPDCENTRFCPPVVYDPREVFVFWIDEELKAATQAARRAGEVFPEVSRVIDAYRLPPPGAQAGKSEPSAEEEAAGGE